MKLTTLLSTRCQAAVSRTASIALATAALILTSTGAHAGGGTWGQTTVGTYAWTATSDWSSGNIAGSTGANATSTGDTSTATFGTITASNTITVDSYRNVMNILFNGASANQEGYNLTGGPLNLTAGGSIYNTTTNVGATEISVAINLEGNYSFNGSGSAPLFFGVANFGLGGAITEQGGGTSGTYTLTLTGTSGIPSVTQPWNGANEIDAVIGQGTGMVLNVTKNGTGEWATVAASTYTGVTTIDGGILNVGSLSNEGTAGTLGEGSHTAALSAPDLVFNGGVLQFSGYSGTSGQFTNFATGTSTNRLFTIGDSTGTGSGTLANPYTAGIDNEQFQFNPNYWNTSQNTISFTNTGVIAFSDAGTGGIGSNTGPGNTYHTLTLSGSNIGNNTFDPQILDDSGSSGSAPTTLVKSGAGTWILGNSNSYTGGTQINGGTLADVTGSGVSQQGLLTLNGGIYLGPGGGNFTRTLGSTGTNVQVTGGEAGFGAYGGAATLNIGNNGSTLKFGTATFNPTTLVLNNQLSNNTLTVTNGFDLNGSTRTIATYAGTAIINGAIINSSSATSSAAGLDKGGNGVLQLTATNSYNGLTGVEDGILWSSATGALGTNKGVINVGGNGELRIDAAADMPGTVLLNHGIFGINFNGSQSTINGLLNSNSSGAVALDTTDTNNFNMGTLGNGSLFLGSSTANGVYGGTALTAAGGGTEPYSNPIGAVLNNFGGVYRLGGGGGTLTFTNGNVVTDQTYEANLLNNPTGIQNLNTSNNYNSVVIGDGSTLGQANGGGTVDFQNKQNYDGLTTINAGYTLNLDFSNTNSKVTSNILNPTNIVNLNGGTLEVTNGISNTSSPTTYSQTLGGLNTFGGANTIAINDTGTGAVTVNLGALNSTTTNAGNSGLYASNNGTVESNTGVNMSTGSTVLFDVTGTSGTATYQATTTRSSDNATLGGQYVYENGNTGVYTWVGATTTGTTGVYNLGAYTSDTLNLPLSNSVASTDYLITTAGTTTLGASESINLLRTANAGTGLITVTTATGKSLTANGILDDSNGSVTIGGGFLNVGSSGNLYVYNYSPNSSIFTGNNVLNIAGASGTGNITFGGTGAIELSGGISNSGNIYLDGATLQVATSNNMFINNTSANQYFIINSGTIYASGETTGTATVGGFNVILNGNFTLSHLSSADTFAAEALMTNNITITYNDSVAAWSIGTLVDGGFGYGLTIGANSQNPYNGTGVALNTTPNLTGTNTFTGPITVLGDAISFGNSLASNRFNVLQLGHDTAAYLGAANPVLAGLSDVGAPGANEVIANSTTSQQYLYLDGNGNYSFGGSINNSSTGVKEDLVMQGAGGTQTLTGTSTYTGNTYVLAGTLNVDGSKGGALTGTTPLILGGGTLQYEGSAGGGTETLGGTSYSGSGSATITANASSGNTTINLGALSAATTGQVLDINEIGTNGTDTVTTTSTTYNAPNAHVVFTQGGTTSWAIASTAGGVATTYAFSGYTGDTTALLTTGASSATNYSITSATAQTQTASESAGLLRISDTTTGGSWDLNGKTLQINSDGILFTGTSAYTIKDTPGTGVLVSGSADKELIIQNYGSSGAPLTISSIIGNNSTGSTALVLAGTGNTVLTAANTYAGQTYLNGGVTTISKLTSLSTNQITFNGGTLQYATGFSGVNGTTSGGDLATTSGTFTHQVNIGDAGATIDTNGNTITFGATSGISQQIGQGTSAVTNPGGVTYVDSANANSGGQGVLNFNASANYGGASTIGSGGVVNLGGAANSGVMNTPGGTIVASGGTLEGGTTQSTSAAQITTSAYAGKITVQSGGNLVVGAPNATLSTALNAVDTNGNIATDGNNKLNVLEAAQLTWQAGGTLSFKLSSTGNEGSSVVSPSSSTQLNLGTGALVKSGTGQFVLNFENTGAYNNDGTPNVYDLINFGSSDLEGTNNGSNGIYNYSIGPNGDTNFTVDDFTIENLDGSGVLSFYYNSNADNNLGQEELILTMVPEPSTWAMLIGGLATLIFWTRRKRTAARSFIKKP